ncbi:MAG: hypothetical protein K0R92_2322 [Lachnospiraceae bacterium]|jgi:flagellar biosynthesis/type III secretory pathway chaperone|nr:hypothetical protein [Lachnospiraceae bacterium]
MEELIATLEQEYHVYEELLPIEEDKTKVIVRNDLQALQQITDQEQNVVDKINALERKREEILVNIGTVISRDPKTLRIQTIIQMLEKQPKEQKHLSDIHDNLVKIIHRLMEKNRHNNSLIQQSLEMIEFNMNFIQSTRMLPGNNGYNKGASQYDASAMQSGMFDTKQ